jgi:hypothetical protein
MHIYISIVAAGITLWLLHRLHARWQARDRTPGVMREVVLPSLAYIIGGAAALAAFVGLVMLNNCYVRGGCF